MMTPVYRFTFPVFTRQAQTHLTEEIANAKRSPIGAFIRRVSPASLLIR